MERKYFVINEELAFQARRQWSFTDYVKGTLTKEYQESCNNVYDLVDKVETEKPQYIEEAYKIALRYAEKYANWINTKHNIDMMCPSVMICGAGNFPTKKKEKQNSRMESHYKDYDYIKSLPNKIEKILKGETIIKSGDSDAIEKLKEKLAELETLQSDMKKANIYYKKNNTLKGYEMFKDYSEEKIQELDKTIGESWNKKPFESFQLTNNNAKIKSTKNRISELEKAKEKGNVEITVTKHESENELFKVVENTELMRLQLLFDGKPSDEVRDIVKKNGFKWSPKNGAWQRQLTENARYSLKRVVEQLKVIA